MVKVVLFDLDGTLLPLDVETFLEDYIKAIELRLPVLQSQRHL